MNQQQFESFTASSLYCEKCKAAMPVRERLLLVLPDKELFDYLRQHADGGVPTNPFADELPKAAKSLKQSYQVAYAT